MQNVIAIYHQPQECGSAYLAFISQNSGEILNTVDIPSGYLYSGLEMVTTLKKVKTITGHVSQSKKPDVDNVDPYSVVNTATNRNQLKFMMRRKSKRYVFKTSKVNITGEDDYLFHTYEADVEVDVLLKTEEMKFDSKKDTFKSQMSASGFNMKGWCLYKRRQTNFMDFLRIITKSYKDYNVINLIQIG